MADSKWQERLKNLGRNDECTCGSKKKYKKCCLEADEKKKSEEIAATQAVAKAKVEKEMAEHKHDEHCDHGHHEHPQAHEHGGTSSVKPHAPTGAMKQVSAPRKVGSG
jgi:hypothetical protein